MKTGVGRAQIGQWYLHWDKGELFQVTGLDTESQTIEIQTFDGGVGEIEEDSWRTLALSRAEQPEGWTTSIDALKVDDLGYLEAEMSEEDSEVTVEFVGVIEEAWEVKGDIAMRVDQLMTKQVTWCGPDDTLERAAQLMWDNDCGCLPVCIDGVRVTGVITDRDICMSALFQGKALRELRVASAMARTLKACRPSDSLADAEKSMSEARIRRLPVVDDKGSLVGIIALADLAREAAREQSEGKSDVTEAAVGDTLAAICQPISQKLAA